MALPEGPPSKHPNLAEELLQKFNDPSTFTDILVKCEDEEFGCHRLVLSSESSVFAAMFSHESLAENQTRCITITDFKAPEVKLALEMAYGKKLSSSTDTPLSLAVLTFANKYDMERVKKEVEVEVGDRLLYTDVRIVAAVLLRADEHEAEVLRKRAFEVLVAKIDENNQKEIYTMICQKQPGLMAEIAAAFQSRYSAAMKKCQEFSVQNVWQA